jgi:hypothetical protein
MRIISSTRDYYDSVMGFGADLSVVYNRKPEIIDAVTFDICAPYNTASNLYEGGVLVICGQPLVRVRLRYTEKLARQNTHVERVTEWRDTYSPRLELNKKEYWRNWRDYMSQEFVESMAPSFWETMCVTHNSPLLLLQPYQEYRFDGMTVSQEVRSAADSLYGQRRGYTSSIWTVMRDPILRNLDMQQLVHPFDMYQRIAQFLSCQLAAERDNTVKLTDVERLEKHGFDKKTSFRNTKD